MKTNTSPAGQAWCRRARLLCAVTMLAAATTAAAQARDLIFARVSEHLSVDPHFNNAGNDGSTFPNVFESLITYDAAHATQPLLATAWRIVSPLVWEFDLRPGITFHDGSPFTAEDVAASIERPRKMQASPASWFKAVAAVERVEVISPLKLRLITREPTPLLLDQIGGLAIISKAAARDASTDDFNAGKAAIGTGQYRFVSWQRGDRLTMTANPAYWGAKPEFDNVQLRFISNNGARTAALLSGSVDVIDAVPPTDVAPLASRGDVKLWAALTTRLTHLQVDTMRDVSPFVTDADGQPMDRNPLRDPRVRRAISKMINREALVERIANGQGLAAGQVVPSTEGGHAADLLPDAFDPEGAKRLLAEAGYPRGFGLTIQSTNDRFPEDSAVLQALGQMLTRGGIRINGVVSMPFSMLLTQASQRKLSLFQYAYNGSGANASEFLKNIMATPDPAIGYGASNRFLNSNPRFDAVLSQALGEFDEAKRNALLADATRVAIRDELGGMIPLYWQKHSWATRSGLSYEANVQDLSLIRFVHIAR